MTRWRGVKYLPEDDKLTANAKMLACFLYDGEIELPSDELWHFIMWKLQPEILEHCKLNQFDSFVEVHKKLKELYTSDELYIWCGR